MKQNYPFIRIVDLLLRIIWYLQCLFALVLLLSAISILGDVSWFNVEKIKGFHIPFSAIDLESAQIYEQTSSEVTLTNGSGRLHISGADQNLTVFKIMAAFIELLVWMYIILMLRKMFAHLKKGEFFVSVNGKYLTRIAFSVIAISMFLCVFNYILSSHIFHNVSVDGVLLKRTAELDYRTLLFGIMLLVMARIFIRGTEIKEEQDLTI